MTRVAVVDYGAGNLGNARRAVAALGFTERLASTPAGLETDGPILLPGVGAHGPAMAELRRSGLADALREAARAGRPVIGICLGMQLLFDTSEEGDTMGGLGILAGRVRRVRSDGRPLPHLGWAPVGREGRAYYFAHSFCAEPADPSVVRATADWGERFPAIVRHGSVVGFQFHPERSGAPGLALLGRTLRGEAPQP